MSPPTRMSFADANARYGIARCLAAYDNDDRVSVYEAGAVVRELDLGELGPCVVTGDLIVECDVVGMDAEAGYLVVLGSCKARNVLIGGPEVWIEKDLIVGNGVLADYNHGSLTVGGDLVASVLCAEHIVRVGGTVRGTSIDFGGLQVASSGFVPTLARNVAVYEAKQRFVPEALNAQGYVSGAQLCELMRDGKPILRPAAPSG